MKIEAIMNKDDARAIIEEIADKLEIDLIDFGVREKTKDEIRIEGDLLEAVMAGLVYYDEEKQCLAQKLTRKIVAGDFERDHLYYRYKFKVKDARKLKKEDSLLDSQLDMLSRICDVPRAIFNEFHGRNLDIALACVDFFLK